jgi:hypothetical protein
MADSTAAPIIAPTASSATPQPPWTPLRPLKGALVAINRTTCLPSSVVCFQYNPLELTREIKAVYPKRATQGGDGTKDYDDTRFAGTADQTISLSITLDATEDGGPLQTGVLPQLAQLELLLNPTSTALTTYLTAAESSTIVVMPELAPRLLFIWGPSRVLPVKLGALSVKEKQFNSFLSPIFAEVSMKLTVCPFNKASDPELTYLQTNLQILETLGAVGQIQSAMIGVSPLGLT